MSAKPILKWAGGKRRIMSLLDPLLPPIETIEDYAEPFFGGGAMYLHLLGRGMDAHERLNDANLSLICFYQAVGEWPDEVASIAVRFAMQHSGPAFDEARALFNALRPLLGTDRASSEIKKLHAGLFLYLNKTCFNGLWRVNKKGKFNTPWNADARWTPSAPELAKELDAFRVETFEGLFSSLRFDRFLDRQDPDEGSFWFVDPPYYTGDGFTAYTKDGWGEVDLRALAANLSPAATLGARVMMTHADTPFVRELFADPSFNITEIQAPRCIAASGDKRAPASEIVIRNYT